MGEISESSESGDQVRGVTAPEVQAGIDADTAHTIRLYAGQPREVLDRRLAELNREWDIERILQANASTLALTGVVLALTGRRRALLLSAAVLGFLLQHAIRGWCPPVPLLRRRGVRTQREIERERYALKALRGDFDQLGGGADDGHDPASVLRAVEQ